MQLKEKLSIQNILLLIMVSAFIISDYMRRFLFLSFSNIQKETIYNINYLFIILYIVFIFKYRKSMNKKYVIGSLILVAIQIINIFLGHTRIKGVFFEVVYFTLILTIIGVKLTKEEKKEVIKNFLLFFNIFTVILLLLGIFDYIFDRSIQYFLVNINYFPNYFAEDLINIKVNNIDEIYRYLSFFGHPLKNAMVFIAFYIINFLYNEKFKKITYYAIYSSVMLAGIILSNGKTAIVIAIFLIIYAYLTNYKLSKKNIIIILLLMLAIVNTGVVKNTVINRFEEAIVNKDLFSGRNILFKKISTGEILPPRLFSSGEAYSNEITLKVNPNISSIEYPFMILAYDKGILYTIILYSLILYQLYRMIKARNVKCAITYLLFNVYVNTYNSIVVHGDSFLQYILINIIIILCFESSIDDEEILC